MAKPRARCRSKNLPRGPLASGLGGGTSCLCKLFAAVIQGSFKGSGNFSEFSEQVCALPHSKDAFPLTSDI